MGVFPGLPNELFSEIVRLLLPSEDQPLRDRGWRSMHGIVSLASTSRTLRGEISPLIYQHAAKYYPALLFWACDRGQTNLVKELLTAGVNPNHPFHSGSTHDTVETMLSMPPGRRPTQAFESFDGTGLSWHMCFAAMPGIVNDAPQRDSNGMANDIRRALNHYNEEHDPSDVPLLAFPIHFAANAGHADVVELLLENEAEANVPSVGLDYIADDIHSDRADGNIPQWNTLALAIASRNLRTIELVLDGGRRGIVTDVLGRVTAFHSAAAVGDEATIDLLLKKVSTDDYFGAVKDMDDLLLTCPLVYQDKQGMSPLQHAYSAGNLTNVEHLLRLGADADGGSDDKYTPLIAACIDQQTDVVKLLISHGADVNAICTKGLDVDGIVGKHLRALDICCRRDEPENTDLVTALLAAGAQVAYPRGFARNEDPVTAAAATHQPDVLRQLLEAGGRANRDAHRSRLSLPLNAAISSCPPDSVFDRDSGQLIESCSVDGEIMGSHVSTDPVDIEEPTQRMVTCISLLLEHGADPNAPDIHHKTAFDHLCDAQNPDSCAEEEYIDDDGNVNAELPSYCAETFLNEAVALQVAKLLLKASPQAEPVNDDRMNERRKPERKQNMSLLENSFVKNSPEFCMSIIEHGARLWKKPDELKSVFSRLMIGQMARQFSQRYSSRDLLQGSIRMVWETKSSSAVYDKALGVLAAMDVDGQLWQDPWFLDMALRSTFSPDQVVLFLVETFKEQLCESIKSKGRARLLLNSAIQSRRPKRVRVVLSLSDEGYMFWHEGIGDSLLAEATGNLQDQDSATPPIATMLLERGFPLHWVSSQHADADPSEDNGGTEAAAPRIRLQPWQQWPGMFSEEADAPLEHPECTEMCMALERDPVRNSPICGAILDNQVSLVEMLLYRCPLTDEVPPEYHVAYLTEACFVRKSTDLLYFLLRYGANPNARHPVTGETALLRWT